MVDVIAEITESTVSNTMKSADAARNKQLARNETGDSISIFLKLCASLMIKQSKREQLKADFDNGLEL